MMVLLHDFYPYLDRSRDDGFRAIPAMPEALVAELILINAEHEELYGTPVVRLDDISAEAMQRACKRAEAMLAEYEDEPGED
jgi:hypothetical protein